MKASAKLTIPRMFSDVSRLGGSCSRPFSSRQLVVCVSGAARFRGGDEATRVLRAGESLIDANTEGLGHVSEVISDVPFEAYFIALI